MNLADITPVDGVGQHIKTLRTSRGYFRTGKTHAVTGPVEMRDGNWNHYWVEPLTTVCGRKIVPFGTSERGSWQRLLQLPNHTHETGICLNCVKKTEAHA